MGEGLSSGAATVLFVDDDADVLTAADVLLTRNGYRMLRAQSPAEAWTVLAAEPVDVILLDLNYSRGATSGAEGFQWLGEIRAHDPQSVVVVVTGHSGISIAVAAMKAGAADFVMKPWSNARLLDTVCDAVALRRQQVDAREGEAPPAADRALLIGDSEAIRRVRDRIERVAPTDAAVLLRGEAGAGKSLAARLIHERSARAQGPFVTLDLRGLATEAEIADAVRRAAGGTLHLDEIAVLSAAAQAELLRTLDQADVRLLSSTRRSRAELTGLRDDLLARLDTVEIVLPSLAERGDDAVQLAEHFARLFARRYGRSPMPLESSALEVLKTQPPPGEVRGLRQAAERAVALGEREVLTAADFLPPSEAAAPPPAAPDLNLSRSERAVVEAALKRRAHNVSQAAKDLGLTRAALYRRMTKHGL